MLSINYTPDQLLQLTGGVYHQKAFDEENIKDVLIDSRRLVNPEHCLFIALKTRKNDGHNYVADLYNKGVRNYILDHIPDNAQDLTNANIILVKDTLRALQKIGEYHRKQFDIPVIGITGSNGKTIVKEWLYQLLQNDYNIVRSPKSYNSQVGVALSALQMNEDNNLAIFEAGISETDEMERLQAIVRPTIGVFTNIGQAHNENFINIPQKVGEKLKLFTAVDTLIYSSDHYEIREQIIKSELSRKINIFKWSKNADADLLIQEISRNQRQTNIRGIYQSRNVEIIIPFTDHASIENAIHCWMTMLLLGYDNDTINERMQSLSPVAMRLELKEGINHCSVINDSYNSDFNALVIALDFMNQQKQHQKKTVVLSDILQSGMNNLTLYQSVYELLKEKQIDRLIGIGKNISQQSNQFQDMDAEFYPSTEDFLNKFSIASFNNETILLKGARMFEFERINKVLQQQSHETVMEINLNALIDNYNYFRSVVKPEARIMAMVKAFSYGSGSFEIANILQYHRVDYLGVAYTDEGVELRKSGITLPLMVMNPEEHSFDIMIRHNLEPEIYSFRVLDLLDKAIERNIVQDQKPVGIHLKLDTGMRRLGFTEDELEEVIAKIQNNPLIRINSVFSHLAASDEPDETAFTKSQISSFEKMASKIQDNFDYEIIRHISNSAAITRYTDAQFDMVRLGIGLYGVATDPAIKDKLRNVSRLKTSISQIKYISKGETVGYSRAFKADSDMKIGIIPIGYADGLSRILSNRKGKLWVNGNSAPIVGNICMDMCMVDLNGLEVEEGDEVIVFDDQHNIEEMAKDLGTIPYEVLTNVSRRVKRVYYHEG
ncbi:MAG: bifunctional UDP-N-acetylmuramoyl-tripeptide:D-alanyl-D-alanine ligase/alanine racemase [Bacteroidales bacterium]|nr:bifunctional UDP-N-acetylmuramoyl-tripeptide:D-alanyl-D-alanine ligase/alanine racemase [Bacteroidales bacterium]